MNLKGLVSLIITIGIIVSAYFIKTNQINTNIEDVRKQVEINTAMQLRYRETDSLKYITIQLQIEQLKNDIETDRLLLSTQK